MLPTYEGLPNLASFLMEFEEKVTELQRLSGLDYVLKDTLAIWWGTHKKAISEWPQFQQLLEIRFGEEISYFDQKYIGLTNPLEHIEHYRVGSSIHTCIGNGTKELVYINGDVKKNYRMGIFRHMLHPYI